MYLITQWTSEICKTIKIFSDMHTRPICLSSDSKTSLSTKQYIYFIDIEQKKCLINSLDFTSVRAKGESNRSIMIPQTFFWSWYHKLHYIAKNFGFAGNIELQVRVPGQVRCGVSLCLVNIFFLHLNAVICSSPVYSRKKYWAHV